MQLGHYVGRHIINLKSNQLKRERKDILGTVLKSKSPSLVLGKANQFGFVFVMFSSLVFLFLIINNIEIRIKARTESKNWNVVVDVNRNQQRKYFFFISFNFQVPSSKNACEQKQSYRHIYAESSYLMSSLPKKDKQTSSFPWWLQLKSVCLRSHPDTQHKKPPIQILSLHRMPPSAALSSSPERLGHTSTGKHECLNPLSFVTRD